MGPGDGQFPGGEECTQGAPALPHSPQVPPVTVGAATGLFSSSHGASGRGAWNQEAFQSTGPCAKPGSMCAVAWLERPVSPFTQLGFNVDGASRCLLGRGPGSGVADERVDGGRGRASITQPRSLAGCGLLSPLLPGGPPLAQECAWHSYSQYPQGGPVGLCALWTPEGLQP